MMTNDEQVFRALSMQDMADAWSGDSDAPTGYFALVEVPEDPESLDQYMRDALGEDWTSGYLTAPSAGWYIIHINSQGFVGINRCEDDEDAREAFAALEAEYDEYARDEWDTDD